MQDFSVVVFVLNMGSEDDVSIVFRRICLDARERMLGQVGEFNSKTFAAEISCSVADLV